MAEIKITAGWLTVNNARWISGASSCLVLRGGPGRGDSLTSTPHCCYGGCEPASHGKGWPGDRRNCNYKDV